MRLEETYGPNLCGVALQTLKEIQYLGALAEYEEVAVGKPTVAGLVQFLGDKIRGLGRGDARAVALGQRMAILESWADEQKLRAENAVLEQVLRGNAMSRTVSNEHPTYVIETKLLYFRDSTLEAGEARQWIYDASTREVRAAA